MTSAIIIEVDGIPKGQPRPRAFSRSGKARVHDPGTAECWKGAIALTAIPLRPASPLTGPLRVTITFYMLRPKRLMRKIDPTYAIPHTATPDADNLAKAVLDCLTEIGMWVDDSQVYKLNIEKLYHAKGNRPGAVIHMFVQDEDDE